MSLVDTISSWCQCSSVGPKKQFSAVKWMSQSQGGESSCAHYQIPVMVERVEKTVKLLLDICHIEAFLFNTMRHFLLPQFSFATMRQFICHSEAFYLPQWVILFCHNELFYLPQWGIFFATVRHFLLPQGIFFCHNGAFSFATMSYFICHNEAFYLPQWGIFICFSESFYLPQWGISQRVILFATMSHFICHSKSLYLPQWVILSSSSLVKAECQYC